MSSLENIYRRMVEGTQKPTAESKMDPVGAHDAVQVNELSKKTLGNYIKGASHSAAGIASGIGGDTRTGKKAHADDTRQLRNRLTGVQRATNKLTKEDTVAWPVYKRILEKSNRADHYKGATPPQPHGDNWARKDREFVNMHGGTSNHKPEPHLDDTVTDSGPHNNVSNVKKAPKRHNDSTVGDTTMPKAPPEAK